MIEKNKLIDYYQTDMFKEFLERMKENMRKETKRDLPGHRDTVRVFKSLMEGLIGSPSKIELQLTILEDIIMDFMTPYTRQLLLERIAKKVEEREYLAKKESIENL